MTVCLLVKESMFNSMNSRAEQSFVSSLYYWDKTDGKNKRTEMKSLSLGLHSTASPFTTLWLVAEWGKSLIFCSCKTPKYRNGKEYYCIPQATGEDPCTWEDAWNHWWILRLYWSKRLFFSLNVSTLKEKIMFLTQISQAQLQNR